MAAQPSFDAPRRARIIAIALIVSVLGAVLALVAPVGVAPVGALTVSQTGVAPDGVACLQGHLHTGAFPQCNGIDLVRTVTVNGVDVAAGTKLALGDVVRVSVVVPPRGDWDAYYKETGDGLYVNEDQEERIRVTLPTQTGTILSTPTTVTMSRTDKGHRGPFPGLNCIFQMEDEGVRNDWSDSVAVGGAAVGTTQMKAAIAGGQLVGRWQDPWVDRCVDATSFNGLYAGHQLIFEQTVLASSATSQTLTWGLGGLALGKEASPDRDNLTWGGTQALSLGLDARPTAPRNVQAVPVDGGIKVSWTAPANNGGSPVASYRVITTLGEDGPTTSQVEVAGTATSLVKEITTTNQFTFRVVAITRAGESVPSNRAGPVAAGRAPRAPSDVTARPGTSSAGLSWRTGSGGSGELAGSQVEVYRDGTYVKTVSLGTPGGPGTVATITGLVDGSSYTFKVRVANTEGLWSGLSAASAAVVVGAPADAPTGVGFTIRPNALRVSWTNPAATAAGPVTGARIRLFTTNGSLAKNLNVTGADINTALVSGLTGGTQYTARVSVTNVHGYGPESSPAGPATAGTPPSTPVITSATPNLTDGTRVDVAFTSTPIAGLPLVNGGELRAYTTAGVLASTQTVIGSPGTISSLTPGVPYTFEVVTRNASGPSAPSARFGPVTPGRVPRAPTVNTAVASPQLAGGINVDWTNPSDTGDGPITGSTTRAYRADGTVAGTQLYSDAIPDATVGGLTPGTGYTYTVQVRNSVGWGPESARFGPVTPVGVPGAPRLDLVDHTGADSVTVYWTPPSADGGSPVQSYRVRAFVDGAEEDQVETTDAAPSAAFPGLVPGETYTFTVEARNGLYWGPPSAPSAPTWVGIPTVPGAPTVTSVSAETETVTVAWSPPASTGGIGLRNFVITPYLDGVAQTPDYAAGDMTERTVPVPLPGLAYTFRVTAVNDIGSGAPSAPLGPVTPMPPPGSPDAPTGVTAVAGDTVATVSWTRPASFGCCAFQRYDVFPIVAGVVQVDGVVSVTATTATITGLANGTSHRFRVVARNTDGPSVASAPSNAVTPAALTVPGAPTVKTITAGVASAVVRWDAPTQTGGSPITGYRVTPYVGAAAQAPVVFTSTAKVQTVTGLTPGTTYKFRVAAINAIGTGATSGLSQAATPTAPTGPPGAPTIGPATAGDAAATVSWTAPTNPGGSPISSYRVIPYVGTVAQPSWEFPASTTTRTVTGLTNGTTYTFRVVAVNGSGAGTPSAASTPVTPAVKVNTPGAPTIGVATPTNGGAIVTWTAPADPGTTAVSGYRVVPYIGTVAQPAWEFPTTATTRTISGLTNGTAYTFKVAAINSWGVGALSAASGAVTPNGPLPAKPNIKSVTAGNGTVLVTWTITPDTGGLPITGSVITPYIAGVAQTPIVFDGPGRTQTVTGLANGTAYRFKVASTTGNGTGAMSSFSDVVTPTA